MRKTKLLSLNKLFVLFLLISFIFTSCDIEKAPYKFIGGFGKLSTDIARTDTIKIEAVQNVMIEDFTGWKCGNCPAASDVVHGLIEKYGEERIIPIKIHATDQFASPDNEHESRDFRNKVGTEIFNSFKGNALPNGMVNRKLVGNSQIVYHTAWGGLAKTALDLPPSIVIKAHSRVIPSADKTTLNAQIQLNYLANGSLDDKLAVYLVEDSIKGVQKDYRKEDPIIDPYYHTEMLRGAITGTWGEFVSLFASEKKNEAPISGQKIPIEYNYEINKDWNPDHLYLVAFVYNEKTKEVIQVIKRKVK